MTEAEALLEIVDGKVVRLTVPAPPTLAVVVRQVREGEVRRWKSRAWAEVCSAEELERSRERRVQKVEGETWVTVYVRPCNDAAGYRGCRLRSMTVCERCGFRWSPSTLLSEVVASMRLSLLFGIVLLQVRSRLKKLWVPC